MRCAVLRWRMVVPERGRGRGGEGGRLVSLGELSAYAMSGTDLAYAAIGLRAMLQRPSICYATRLLCRVRY
eukprot:3940724-Rhodomonas_salina.4